MDPSEPGNDQSAEVDRVSVDPIIAEAPSTAPITNGATLDMESQEKVDLNTPQEPDEMVSKPTNRKKASKSATEKKKPQRTYV